MVTDMDDETLKHLWALREVNKVLITGLKATVFTMEKWDELTPKRWLATIKSLREVISQSEKVYGPEPTKH